MATLHITQRGILMVFSEPTWHSRGRKGCHASVKFSAIKVSSRRLLIFNHPLGEWGASILKNYQYIDIFSRHLSVWPRSIAESWVGKTFLRVWRLGSHYRFHTIDGIQTNQQNHHGREFTFHSIISVKFSGNLLACPKQSLPSVFKPWRTQRA